MADAKDTPPAAGPTTGKESQTAAPKAAAADKAAAPAKVVFNNAIEIDLGTQMPEYGNEFVKGYKARGMGGDTNDYCALVCAPHLTPRSSKGAAYASACGGPMAFLVGSGVINIPGTGERFTFIYRDSLGQRIVKDEKNMALGWKPERVLEKIAVPVITALKDLRDVDIVHGNIRPSNFYNGGKKEYDNILVGECLSVPASMLQPPIFEPLHRCTAQPTGRGIGVIEDDLYALGVSMAMAMRTHDPMAKRTQDEMINHKIQHGTYATLVSKDDRFTGAVLELLRGLLIDEQRQRWSLDDVLAWLDGRRLSPKQAGKRKRASRQLTFNSHGYFYMEALATDIFKKPAEAVNLIESAELEQWIQRSIDDANAVKRLEEAIASANETGKSAGYWDRLLARVSIALDPEGPIRYKTLSLKPEGLGVALAEAFVQNTNLQSFTEIFNSPLLQFWLVTCTDLNMDVSSFVTRFETCRNYIKQPMIGFGLERCLYFLNESVHCVSPALRQFHVRTPEDLLSAFEKIAQGKARPALTLDRHMAAFLAAKDGKVIDNHLYDLNSVDHHRRLIGTVNVFASIQRISGFGPVPALTKWLAEGLQPVIDRFHDKQTREEMKEKLNRIKETGEIAKMTALIDDENTVKRDFAAFKLAMHEYKTLDDEFELLERQLEKPEKYGKERGRDVSVIVAGVLSSLIIMGFIIMYMNGNKLF